MHLIIYCVVSEGNIGGWNNPHFFPPSDQLKMSKDLTKERDQLLTTVEDLREKLNKAITTQQEIETQRDAALEKISQVMWHRLKQKSDG